MTSGCVDEGDAALSFVDLYVFRLDPVKAVLEKMRSVLSEDELARSTRIISVAAGHRFCVARGTLRHVLSTYCTIAPEDLTFAYRSHGKPVLSGLDTGLFFNLSHSGDVGAISVSKEFEVGVDVEIWRPVRDGLADRFFSSSEAMALQEIPGIERTAAFFRCWTRKEAVIKALGEGLSRPLKSFEVSIDDVSRPKMETMEGEMDPRIAWSLFSFSPRQNVSGAVACLSKGKRVALRLCEASI